MEIEGKRVENSENTEEAPIAAATRENREDVVGSAGSRVGERKIEREASKRGRPSNAEKLRRDRTASVGSIRDFLGGKRERAPEETEEGEKQTLKRRNSVAEQLSLTQSSEREGETRNNMTETEDTKRMTDREILLSLFTDMKSMKRENTELKNELYQIKQELYVEKEKERVRREERDRDIDKRFQMWEERMEEMQNNRRIEEIERKLINIQEKEKGNSGKGQPNGSDKSIKMMEDFMERRDREDRKNNIIIKGLAIEKNENDLKGKTEKFIESKIKVKAEILYARRIGNRNWILAKVANFEQKIKIMESKKSLGEEKIYIDNDRTRKEREIQKEVIRTVKQEKERDKNAEIKIGFGKFSVNGIWYYWNERYGTLEKRTFRKESTKPNDMET